MFHLFLRILGFAPLEKALTRPYDCKISDGELHAKDATKTVTKTSHAAGEKVMGKKKASGWDPDYTRRMFFPYWRSVLGARCLVKVYPSHAQAHDLERLNSWSGSLGNGSSQSPNHNLELLGRTQRPTSNHQKRRLFATAAFRGNESSRNPNHNLLLGRIQQTTGNNQSRRFFGTAALTFLKLLKNA